MGGRIYFAARDPQHGLELWTSDGTASGTHLVADIHVGPAQLNSTPCYLAVSGNRIFFAAAGANGRELWTTDGTASGTVQVADIVPGSDGSYPGSLTVFNGAVYFRAQDAAHGAELWKSDGTAAGTTLVADLAPGTASSFASPRGILNGKLLVSVVTLVGQNFHQQLYVSDGTTTGTTLIDTPPIPQTTKILIVGGKAYFLATDASSGTEPWVTDGTAAGTYLLKDINAAGDSAIDSFDEFQGGAIFQVKGAAGDQLWRSDGSNSGTVLIGDVPVEPTYPTPFAGEQHRLAVGNQFFFTASTPDSGSELYALSDDASPPSSGNNGGTPPPPEPTAPTTPTPIPTAPTTPTVPVVASNGKGGGGSTGLFELLALFVLTLGARRTTRRCE
jgi:ELWxxDGT repeat protein